MQTALNDIVANTKMLIQDAVKTTCETMVNKLIETLQKIIPSKSAGRCLPFKFKDRPVADPEGGSGESGFPQSDLMLKSLRFKFLHRRDRISLSVASLMF